MSKEQRLINDHIIDFSSLTLKAPITTAADDKLFDIFPNFRKENMILHENRLPADDSHGISSLICYF